MSFAHYKCKFLSTLSMNDRRQLIFRLCCLSVASLALLPHNALPEALVCLPQTSVIVADAPPSHHHSNAAGR